MVEHRVRGIFSILKLHRFLEIAMSNKTPRNREAFKIELNPLSASVTLI